METPELFYENYLAGLRDDVQALGGAKTIGTLLFPEKEILVARNTLNDRLNLGRRERLSDEQERWIMRKAREKRGFSAALYFICDDAGFQRPAAKDPEDEKAKLQRQVIEAAQLMRQSVDRLERLTQSPLQAVK